MNKLTKNKITDSREINQLNNKVEKLALENQELFENDLAIISVIKEISQLMREIVSVARSLANVVEQNKKSSSINNKSILLLCKSFEDFLNSNSIKETLKN